MTDVTASGDPEENGTPTRLLQGVGDGLGRCWNGSYGSLRSTVTSVKLVPGSDTRQPVSQT